MAATLQSKRGTMNSELWALSLRLFVAIPVLVLLNAVFVATEFAVVAVRRTKLEELANAGRRGARAALEAQTNIGQTIAAIQLGVTLTSLSLGWIGEPALAGVIEPL